MRWMNRRKASYPILSPYYLNKDAGEKIRDNELNEANTSPLYNPYRPKCAILLPEKIQAVPEQYGLSADTMLVIPGYAIHGYRNLKAGSSFLCQMVYCSGWLKAARNSGI